VEESDWGHDPQGVTNGIAGLYLTPQELAKYGFLYLNKGRWDGQQIVSERWVVDSTREHAYIGKDNYTGGLDRRFGYLYSIFPEQKYYGYLGRAGQELFVAPEKDLVIVFTGSLPVGKEGVLLKLMNDYILPAVQSDSPLITTPQNDARLQSLLPPSSQEKQLVPPLPMTAASISGKTFLLDPNPFYWQDMSFQFQTGSDEVILQMKDNPDLKIGLDNLYRFTSFPGRRPVGLRGSWKSADEFIVDYITLGDFLENSVSFRFKGNNLEISVLALNFDGPPQILHGVIQP
jgi:hypothetical protein